MKPVESAQFKAGMRLLAGGVSIITCKHAQLRYGMTATAVCSATADPPTVLICVNKSASTHAAIAKAKSFCVNVLRMEDWHLSAAFSGGRSGEARFETGSWSELATGSPVLAEALVNFDCRLVRRISHGSHTIALGQVEQVRIGANGSPLVYWESRYGMAASLEANQCWARDSKG